MRISLMVSAMFAAVCATFGAQPAMAQPYPAPEPMLLVSAGTVTAGDDVQLTGRDYDPKEVVAIDVADRRYGQVSADAEGQFTTAVRLTVVGTMEITATGKSSGRVASVTVTVLAKGAHKPPAGHVPPAGHMPPAGAATLPVTSAAGFNLPTTLAVGGSAMLMGAGLVLLSVRWRRRNTSDTLA